MAKQKKTTNIEEQLRQAINNSELSRYRISQLSGVSEAAMSLFINNKRTITLDSAAKVAEVLGLILTDNKEER